MLDAKQRAALDQAGATLGEALPLLWKSIYDGCISQGFTEDQSFRILLTYITVSAGK